MRDRFGFTDDELSIAATWARDAGVRWGLSARLRRQYRLEQFPQNTWAGGLDRLLAGVAMAEGELLVGDVLPLDDVPSAEVDLAGRFAELISRVTACVESFLVTDNAAGWLDALVEGVMSIASAPPSQAWQVIQFERTVEGFRSAAITRQERGPTLGLADLRAMLDQAGRARPTRANFRTGALTVCTMVPMRSVPHRVICLMGLEDGSFPRVQTTDGDDVLARDPLTGERDLRSEDRQLLLDAVMAATDRLVITYTGANPLTGQAHPPSVPLGELLDVLDVTAEQPVRHTVLVRHPLQPFDPRNATAGALCGPDPFSFDVSVVRGAEAAEAPSPSRPSLLEAPLAPLPPQDLVLADLQAFLAAPAAAFLRQRLDVALPQEADEPTDAIPLNLDALERWEIGDRMLRRLLDGTPSEAVFDAELRRGQLPPGTLGDQLFADIGRRAAGLIGTTRSLRQLPRRVLDIEVPLGGGRRVVGEVPDVRGTRVVRVYYSALNPKHRLAAWVDLLCLAGAYPDSAWAASTVGWDSRAQAARVSELGPLDKDPLPLLHHLVGLYDLGLREPLPMPLRTAYTWADAVRKDRDTMPATKREWEGAGPADPLAERARREHVLVYGEAADFEDLAGRAWRQGASRFAALATGLWDPIFDHERVRRL